MKGMVIRGAVLTAMLLAGSTGQLAAHPHAGAVSGAVHVLLHAVQGVGLIGGVVALGVVGARLITGTHLRRRR